MIRTFLTRVTLTAMPLALSATLVFGPSPASALSPNQTTPTGVVQALNADLNYFWWLTFRSSGWSYTAPVAYVWYDGAGYPQTVPMSGCGVTSLNNSYYCSTDHRIYVDLNWHQALISRYGDMGSGVVIAHEWSHHIQTICQGDWMQWAAHWGLFAGRELQADCYAGTYFRWLANHGRLAAGDLEEARAWMRDNGDQAGTSPYARQAHGSGWQREHWFLVGYSSYSLGSCDQVYASTYWPSLGAKAN